MFSLSRSFGLLQASAPQHTSKRAAALLVGLLGVSSFPAQAQLWATPQETALQPVLSGFTAQQQGRVLRQGQTSMTLDVVAGRVVGVLIEGQDLTSVSRALLGAWGGEAKNLVGLKAQLSEKAFQNRARLGFVQVTDQTGADLLAVRLTGSGSAQRWRMYSALNILPESAFPTTRNVSGKATAPNTLHVISDFQCPACRQLWGHQLPLWRQQTDLYRLHYHHYPLSYHRNAYAAAEASECAAQQGKFWAYADRLFGRFDAWSEVSTAQTVPLFKQYATQLKLNQKTFDQCLDQRQPKAEVRRQMRSAETTYVTGTPTIYLNGIQLTERTAQEMQRVQAVTRAKRSASSVIQARLKTFQK